MKSSMAAFLITTWSVIYGAIQLFIVDPAKARQELPIFFIFALDQTSHILLSLLLTFVIWFVVWSDFPTRRGFGFFMLSSLIFSFIGTIRHDQVQYGLGVLLYILPVYFESTIRISRDEPGSQSTTKPSWHGSRRFNWELFNAVIALIALVWTIAVHYGVIP